MTRNIFEALRESHERQRTLYSALTETSGDTPERRELFEQLRTELAAHALAEDRHFYVPLMALDAGMDLSRHAIAEHHDMDELVEDLQARAFNDTGWLALARKLSEKVHHHLREEETKFFQLAGKVLGEAEQRALAKDYEAEFLTLRIKD